MSEKYLDSAYTLEDSRATKNLYDQWANSYDVELAANGYASPLRTAQALMACGADLDKQVLDIGCGTGVSGECLIAAGFSNIVGSDFSQKMLDEAKKKNIYQQLHLANFDNPLEFVTRPVELITAVGVFAPTHADARAMESMFELLAVGGLFGFSLNDHALEDPEYLTFIEQQLYEKRLGVRWQEYGDHLPRIGLNSLIMVVEKLV